MTRQLDPLGRIVIPMEIRRTLGIQTKTPIEILVEEDTIVLRKYETNDTCLITGEVSRNNMRLVNGSIILSPQGADRLVLELEQFLK